MHRASSETLAAFLVAIVPTAKQPSVKIDTGSLNNLPSRFYKPEKKRKWFNARLSSVFKAQFRSFHCVQCICSLRCGSASRFWFGELKSCRQTKLVFKFEDSEKSLERERRQLEPRNRLRKTSRADNDCFGLCFTTSHLGLLSALHVCQECYNTRPSTRALNRLDTP